MEYVRLTTIAAIMGVTDGWLRGLVYQRVMDDERENRVKGSPYIMHVKQIFQAIVALKMRQARIGYDTIRLAVDKFEIDRVKYHKICIDPTDKGMDLIIYKAAYLNKARGILERANDFEYNVEEERQAA